MLSHIKYSNWYSKSKYTRNHSRKKDKIILYNILMYEILYNFYYKNKDIKLEQIKYIFTFIIKQKTKMNFENGFGLQSNG